MKELQYNNSHKKVIIGLLLVILPIMGLMAQVEKTKIVDRTFKVDRDALLSISNKFGEVHINTWDKNEIDLKVTITAEKRSERAAQEHLDKVEIDISESSGHVEIETEISGSINNRNGERLTIDYLVSMPKTNNLELRHSYGDLYLDDLSGDVDMKVSYGDMRVENLTGQCDINISYGNWEIDGVRSGQLNVGYSNLTVENLDNVKLNSQYSNVTISKSRDIELGNKYGKVEIGTVNNLKGSSKYGDLEIDRLYNSIIVDLLHGNGVEIGWISKDFNRVEIDASYAGSSIRFERGFSAQLEGRFKYCDLKYDEDDFDFNYVEKGTTSNEYKGRIGPGSGSSRIILESSYGSIKMGYAR